jgi:hypothetical protein
LKTDRLLGLGLEYLSVWVDARVNYYLPEDKDVVVDTEEQTALLGSTSRTTYSQWAEANTIYERRLTTTTHSFLHEYSETHEGTLEGWDAEIGLRCPTPWDALEARVFGGYYAFEPNIALDTIEGWKGRLEVRALPAILLDFEIFENDELYGADYLAGLRLRVPFNIGNAFQGDNPFAGFAEAFSATPRDFKQRLATDQVMRDAQIQVRQAVEKTQTQYGQSATTQTTLPLYTGVIFVDDSNTSGIEDGTLPFPFDTIAEGLAAAAEGRLVFVFGGQYNESVRIIRSVMLIGEGFGLGGGSGFGSGAFPVVTGQGAAGQGATITVQGGPGSGITAQAGTGAASVTIRGLEITNTGGLEFPEEAEVQSSAAPTAQANPLVDLVDDATGVLAANVPVFDFTGNIVRDTALGLVQWHQGIPGFSSDINANTFSDNGAAIVTLAVDSSGTTRIRDNALTGNLAGIVAADINTASATPTTVAHEITGNTIAGGGINTLINPFLAGLGLSQLTAPPPLPDFGGIGILGLTVGPATASYQIEGNLISDHLIGIGALGAGANATLDLTISGNTISGSGLGVLSSIPAGDIASFLASNPGFVSDLNALGIPAIPTLIAGNYGLIGIGVGSIFSAQTTAVISGNTIDRFALSAVAAAWESGTIGLTLTGNTSPAGGAWWAGNGGAVAPLTVTGNNFPFTQFVP